MMILQRLDATLQSAIDISDSIEEFDLTEADYAELMAFAATFGHEALEQMKLDMMEQTYKDYPMRFSRLLNESIIQLHEGKIPLVDAPAES